MEDTICAAATALGVGAISIIRISGPETIAIVNKIFSSDLTNKESHTITYGFIVDGKEKVDEVLIMLMRSPKTYTKEDIIEINCHGGINTTNKVLELLLKNGARLAEPGEFTKRAYLNGRIDLVEAEAVNDLIFARSDSKRKLALNQLGGNLTQQINDIREILVSLMANIEVNIDYPEYLDNLVITNELLREKIKVISELLKKIIDGSRFGKIITNGINIAIVGKPNVGKSSILNHLLDENKAIVTDIAGTTRDVIEGSLVLKGVEIKFLDTAGIHETGDYVEKIGVEKSLESMKNADINILVLDGSKPLDEDDKQILEMADKKKTIIFINKNDQEIKIDLTQFDDYIVGNTKNVDGLEALKEAIISFFDLNNLNKDLTYISNVRQIDLINKAYDTIINAGKSLDSGIPIDMIESDLNLCYSYLGQIIGDTYDSAVIDRLFSDFCVGK